MSKRPKRWILERVDDPADFTGDAATTTQIETVFLHVEPMSGSEPQREEKHSPETVLKMTCRYRPTIAQGMQFRRDSRVIFIESIIDPGEAHRKMVLSGVEVHG